MKNFDQKKAAKEFAERWKDKGYEKGESQKYWIDLLQNVLGVDDPISFIEFEDTVHIDQGTGFIDGYIPSTKILIEQKSIEKDLKKPVLQSDNSLLKPIQQALKYRANLPYDKQPRWIITCNFKSFLIYDMNNPNGEPEEVLLKDLGKEYYRLSFIVDSKNEHIKKEEELSFKAGELVGKLYDAFSHQYLDLSNKQSQKDLNELCVRLVFCLYAEDAGLFGRKNVFHDYLVKYDDLTLMRENLIKLFKVLDTPLDKRDPYLEEELNQFPYVNGGLFSNENIEIPTFTEEIKNILLAKASDEFDWSEISPTIFGAVFESTLNPETRRAGGMHYTSIENIHKVIDPLFLNKLREKLDEIEAYKSTRIRYDKLVEYQKYLASLKFLDPACGSGNFLTETYLSLRRLENEALEIMSREGAMTLNLGGSEASIRVSIQQFYGIEINDFAVKVAKTALWIAEAQMWEETRKIVSSMASIGDFLPLETYDNIVEGNALRIDWNEVVSNNNCSYIMGNPPFIGSQIMAQGSPQKQDVQYVFDFVDKNEVQDLDYVTCWYKLAAEYIQGTKIEVSFVSTNSICQGSQVPILWNVLFNKYKIKINFAYRTFIWNSESNKKAAVHCVIIGFSLYDRTDKIIYMSDSQHKKVDNIGPYLNEGSNTYVIARKDPLNTKLKMCFGNQPRDGGYFILSPEEKDELLSKEPGLSKWIHEYIGAVEFINNKKRYCIWLRHAEPSDIKNSKTLYEIVEKVREFRINSSAKTTNGYAKVPHLFAQLTQPDGVNYLMIPRVSSERRRYIPIGFMNKDIISSDAVQIIPNATIYEFGILTSNVHMSWMRVVAGRLKSDYRYSKELVYNNFPWPNPTKEQKEKIEKTAKLILDSRAKYPNSSLADLYDEVTMPSDLRRAHQENDKAVMEAYGFNWRKMTESDCVAGLMKMYQELTRDK